MLSIEDAGEEILKGPYTLCKVCKGSGVYKAIAANSVVSFDLDELYCRACKGAGKWVRGDYKAACVLLNLDIPPTPERANTKHHDLKEVAHKFWGTQLKIEDLLAVGRAVEESALVPSFRREYLGEWAAPERDDTADALIYGAAHVARASSGSNLERPQPVPDLPRMQGLRLPGRPRKV